MRAITALLLLTSTAGAADLHAGTIDCAPQRPSGARAYWSYRIIDGRTCWYEGRPGKSKTALRWVNNRTPSVEERPGAAVRTPPNDPRTLSHTCCWPPLEAETEPPPKGKVEDVKPDAMTVPLPRTFNQIWNDLLSDMAEPATRWRQPLKDQQRFNGE